MADSKNKGAFCEGVPRHELLLADPRYPEALLEIKDPPKCLYVIGNPDALKPGLAIVGARKATPYGLSCAQRFSSLAADHGVPVISGGAIGCDLAAHQGALDANGATVCVFGSGADVPYPLRGKDVFERIVNSNGAIVSEEPWGTPPQKWAFKKRNRIIAGLSRAVLIVEAGLPSGTFSTADYALEAGRDVLVVPGSILSRESYGSNRLLADGATAIIDDETFSVAINRIFMVGSIEREVQEDTVLKSCNSIQQQIVRSVAASPLIPDDLLGVGGSTVIEVLKNLSVLEMKGLVTKYPDGRFGTTQAYAKLVSLSH